MEKNIEIILERRNVLDLCREIIFLGRNFVI